MLTRNGEGYSSVFFPNGQLIQPCTTTLNVSLDYVGGRKEHDTERKPADLAPV